MPSEAGVVLKLVMLCAACTGSPQHAVPTFIADQSGNQLNMVSVGIAWGVTAGIVSAYAFHTSSSELE